MCRFFINFCQPHGIMLWFETVEGGGLRVELIAQDDDEAAQAERAHRAPALRQACEHQRTSFQVRAQALRQLIGRPQAAQGLLGRFRLLPRKQAAEGSAWAVAGGAGWRVWQAHRGL